VLGWLLQKFDFVCYAWEHGDIKIVIPLKGISVPFFMFLQVNFGGSDFDVLGFFCCYF